MSKLTVVSLSTFGAALLLVGGCQNRPGTRHNADHDRDHDERVDERHRRGDRDLDHDEHHEERAEPDVGAGLKTKRAVSAIAKARCEREARCGNVGTGETYASQSACVDKIGAEWAVDLNKYECPHGVIEAALDGCISHIRAEDCGNPIDTLSRIAQCDADDICKGD